jgi:N-acetylglutamate synthase-like GNAT family acetyltransferase
MPNFNLRPATAADMSQIRALIRQVGINPFSLDWRRFCVAETDEGQFIGCAQLKPHEDGSVELASIAVAPAYRGQGVARALIEYWLAHSPRPLYLMCRSELEAFYTRFGFRVLAATAPDLPPYFRRIYRVVRLMVLLRRRQIPLVMRLDA